MIDYASSGVDIKKGDEASRRAYAHAQKTFPSRKGLIGEPFVLEGGFAGALDMGDYLLIQNDDGTGTKTEIAEKLKKFDTLGQDLLCMVCDDAICVGAETISVSNTFDVPHIDVEVLDQMTAGLSQACQKEKIVIPGGEIAEVGKAVRKIVWNATAVGIVRKEKFITGKDIRPNDVIIGLKGRVLRSNGFSLARKIIEKKYGEDGFFTPWKNGLNWGEVLLTPSKIFHRLLLDHILGDFKTPRIFDVKGVVHITGGGIPGNLPRILPDKNWGARLENLHDPHPAVKDLRLLGEVEEKECYRTWHCGTAMMIITDKKSAKNICTVLNNVDNECEAQIVGTITSTPQIEIVSRFSGEKLTF